MLIRHHKIHPAETEQIIELFVSPVDYADKDIRIKLRKLCHCLVELLPAVAPQVSDPQLLFAVPADPDRLSADSFDIVQYALTLLVKIFTCGRKGKSPVFPFDQLHSQIFFQCLDLLRNGRLRDIALIRRPSKAAAVCNCRKIFHLPEQQKNTCLFLVPALCRPILPECN